MQVAANTVGLAGAVGRENWSLWEGYAGSDPGYNQTCKCEIHLKGKQQIKLHNKGNIIFLPFSTISFIHLSPPFFAFTHPHTFIHLVGCFHNLIQQMAVGFNKIFLCDVVHWNTFGTEMCNV